MDKTQKVYLLLSFSFLLIAPITAYAQTTPDVIYESAPSTEAKRMAIELAVAEVWELVDRSPTISISEDGTLMIMDLFTEGSTTTVGVQTNLTQANGYEINNGAMTAPNGTKVFP